MSFIRTYFSWTRIERVGTDQERILEVILIGIIIKILLGQDVIFLLEKLNSYGLVLLQGLLVIDFILAVDKLRRQGLLALSLYFFRALDVKTLRPLKVP